MFDISKKLSRKRLNDSTLSNLEDIDELDPLKYYTFAVHESPQIQTRLRNKDASRFPVINMKLYDAESRTVELSAFYEAAKILQERLKLAPKVPYWIKLKNISKIELEDDKPDVYADIKRWKLKFEKNQHQLSEIEVLSSPPTYVLKRSRMTGTSQEEAMEITSLNDLISVLKTKKFVTFCNMKVEIAIEPNFNGDKTRLTSYVTDANMKLKARIEIKKPRDELQQYSVIKISHAIARYDRGADITNNKKPNVLTLFVDNAYQIEDVADADVWDYDYEDLLLAVE